MISCSDYDYIEIACMHGYDVELQLINGDTLRGKALDTLSCHLHGHALKQECIILRTQEAEIRVVLNDIKSMVVLSEKPSFKHVDFTHKF